MATEEDTDTLKLYWDHFFKAETGTYEKSTWLDLFLAEFLVRVNEGANPKELIKFCPVSGVVTLVGCELLCGIHRVTSSISTHYAPLPHDVTQPDPPLDLQHTECESKPSEPKAGSSGLFSRVSAAQSSEAILRKYLLGGVAWRCLVLLQALGVEGLSCCRQLSSVLIWVFGELKTAAPQPASPAQPRTKRTPIHELFSHRIWSKQKSLVTQSKGSSAPSSEKGSVTGRSRTSSQLKYDSLDRSKRKTSRVTDPSSDSGDSNDELQVLNRSLAIKVSSPHDDFEYFNSTRSSNEYPNDSYYEPYYTPRKPKPKAEDYMNDKHREIINSEITTFQFQLIITDLLQELCKAESSLTGSEGSQISMQCINFSLRNLCSLQFTSGPPQVNGQESSRTKVALTELLMVSLDQVLIHSDLCAKLINNGILPMLLRVLEDVITKCKANKLEYQTCKDKSESENLLRFVFGIAYSITAFFHCLLMQCRTVDKLREFTDQFQLYGEGMRGGLLASCVQLMIRIPLDGDEPADLCRKLIETIGRLIAGMKRVRSGVLHAAACARARHAACLPRVLAGAHHHHALLGAAPPRPLPATCAVALLYGALAQLLADEQLAARAALRTRLLRVMLAAGPCCCLPPDALVRAAARLMLLQPGAAPLCVALLEHTVYGALGGPVLAPRAAPPPPCAVCEGAAPPGPCPLAGAGERGGFGFLYHYTSLLQLDNPRAVLHATVTHLLRVMPRCRAAVTHELLFSVVYPTFIVAKHRYMMRQDEAAYFLTGACLTMFATLLDTVSFAEQFIQKGGLSYVLELVSLPEFSNQCCAILEIAIVVEMFKLTKENSELSYYRELSSLPSVQMLFKSLTEMTEKCYKIYRLKLPAEKFEELCDLTKERDMLAFVPPSSQHLTRQMSSPQSIKSCVDVERDGEEDSLEVLKTACTFWRSCGRLMAHSRALREHVAAEALLADSYALLKLALSCCCQPHQPRQHVALAEALLTVQLAASDVTSGRSKETTCMIVRNALSGASSALQGGGGVRALCDALIRVAAARPAAPSAAPRPTSAKAGALGCASGASSEASSSEDSLPPHHTHQDDGYEADVEVGKLDLPTLFRTRKLSAGTINATGVQSPTLDISSDYKSEDLAHPELCVIVVDVLTQLIHKLVECRGAGGAEWAVGAGVARAWCGRVALALARARAHHAPLLRRLLAAAAQPHLLAIHDPRLTDLQHSILELIHVLASQSIEPPELLSFLRLFTSESPPLGLLLSALHRLVSAAAPNTPDCILSFPVDTDNTEGTFPLVDEPGFVCVSGNSSHSRAAEACARRYRDTHIANGWVSAWSRHALRVCVEGAGWAPWQAGFAADMWVHTHHQHTHTEEEDEESNDDLPEGDTVKKKPPAQEPPSKPTELSHVLSVGHDTLMFEMWLDTGTGCLVFRLSRPEAGGARVVSEVHTGYCVAPRRWTCLALNVRDHVFKRHLYLQVTLFVNGYEYETVSLPIQGILVRKVTPTTVLIGHGCGRGAAGGAGGVGGGAGAYHVAGLRVARAPLLTAPLALHIAAHGPDDSCQVRCESPNYPSVLTPNVLDSNIDWDQVFEISAATLREYHDNLLLSFSAQAPNIVNLYHQTVAMPPAFVGRVASAGLMSSSASGAPASTQGASIPEALFPTWTGAPIARRHRGIAPAVFLLGGPDVLLYLYAKVVELRGSAEEQALALSVLLRACSVDARLHAMLHEHAHDMLLTVFAAPDAILTHHLLKVVFDAACSGSVLACSGEVGVLLARSDALVLQPRLLLLLVRAWRHLDTQEMSWEVETVEGPRTVQRGTPWALALCALRALLRPSHPRRAFNLYQLSRLDLLQHLLHACKERFLGAGGALGAAGTAALCRALLAAPPLLQRLALLADFLLLMHQASDTFVTHSRANFYFLLTPETQEMSEFSTSSLKKRPSKRNNSRDEHRRSISSVSDEVNESNLIALKDMAQSSEVEMDRIDSSGSESTKQMKSEINEKIKEARKHTPSTTSENSDSPPDADELTEYIVVDVDDVHHTTVEMYAGGIYQQRRVRAGAAEGWSACEGLLLLLRDALAALPDHAHHQAAAGAVPAEVVCVLCNQRGAAGRAAATRAAAALARRAAPDAARRLLQQHYYLHLADQISLYPCSWELAAAAAALLTKCDVPLEDQLDDDIWTDVTEEALVRSPPLLALLPACLHDVPLAHNVSLLVRRLIDKASLKLLSELCVGEVVVRSVRSVAQELPAQAEGRALLLQDLHELLNRVALKALNTPHSMQSVLELHHMLTYIELCGDARVRRTARDAQLALYTAQLDQLEHKLHASYSNAKLPNYFTTVLTSAVSLGDNSLRSERGELAARHLSTVTRAVNFLLTASPHEPLDNDALLFDRLLNTLLLAVSSASRPKWWVGSGSEGAEALAELFWWGAAPARGARALQPGLLRALYGAPPPVLHALTPTDPANQRKLTVYLLSMLQHLHLSAEAGADGQAGAGGVELGVSAWARGWALGAQASLPARPPPHEHEAAALLQQDLQRWERRAHRVRPAIAKVVWRNEGLAQRVAESAMSMTRCVVDAQNAQRKGFMELLRRTHALRAAAAHRWQRLIHTYTHEQAVWWEERCWARSWQLDPTEGPGRVRVRMRRAHLHVPKKFLKPEHQYKAESAFVPPPLHAVVGAGGGGARLAPHETVAYMARVTCVTAAAELDGELLLTDTCLHFVPERAPAAPAAPPRGTGVERKKKLCVPELVAAAQPQAWPLRHVLQLATRRWCLVERAVELFLSSGHAHMLAFADQPERAAFLRALAATSHPPARIEPDTLTEAMSSWRNGTITNWEYLMRLNGLGGRSYNDLMQYPVLPFVLSDYSSRILDLTDPASFRDLAKPMAVQNKNKEQHYIRIYNDLQAAAREGCGSLVSRGAHHYASLYSNSGAVLHYLVRVPPFTELFFNYQDDNFDMPDRTFHSLATTWRLITNDSPTDVKELIPEMFYLPELFHNNEGLNLGVRQCGLGVDSVTLPAWAADARLFTLLQRQALEAPHVTERLPHWIDLVFGYKQTGAPALDALNVFPACTYYGFELSALADPLERSAAEAMVRMYGQAPRQLLRAPHPHAGADLLPRAGAEVWGGVRGARWGAWAGAPPSPLRLAARRPLRAARLHALPHGRAVAAAADNTALLSLHGDSAAGGALGLLSWGHSDSAVRLKRRRDARPDLLLHVPALDQITCVATCWAGGAWGAVLGHASGRVLAVRARAPPGAPRTRSLHAHRAALATVALCARAALLVTADVAGLLVLWDLHKLTYIRTLPNRGMLPVTHAAISETLCDVASVHDMTSRRDAPPDVSAAPADDDADSYEKDAAYRYESLIRVHTCNARFVGSVKVVERVTCVCYSNAPEGASVNGLAAGLASGAVRIYSSWDLRAVLHVAPPDQRVPLVSLTYSSDSSVLFGCYESGLVVAWEADDGSRAAPVRILPAPALL